jgi:hypothetical protein
MVMRKDTRVLAGLQTTPVVQGYRTLQPSGNSGSHSRSFGLICSSRLQLNSSQLNPLPMPDTRRESTSDDGDDSEYYSDDPDITLASIEWSKTINFSIRANYTNWAPREAFRELVQNWYVPFVFPCCLRSR